MAAQRAVVDRARGVGGVDADGTQRRELVGGREHRQLHHGARAARVAHRQQERRALEAHELVLQAPPQGRRARLLAHERRHAPPVDARKVAARRDVDAGAQRQRQRRQLVRLGEGPVVVAHRRAAAHVRQADDQQRQYHEPLRLDAPTLLVQHGARRASAIGTITAVMRLRHEARCLLERAELGSNTTNGLSGWKVLAGYRSVIRGG